MILSSTLQQATDFLKQLSFMPDAAKHRGVLLGFTLLVVAAPNNANNRINKKNN